MKPFDRSPHALALLITVAFCLSLTESQVTEGYAQANVRLGPGNGGTETASVWLGDIGHNQERSRDMVRGSTAAHGDDAGLKGSPLPIPVEVRSGKPYRLQRRAGQRSKYSDAQLREAGLTDEEITRYRTGQKVHNAYGSALDANRKATAPGHVPPFSDEALRKFRPGTTDYHKMRDLVEAIMSGDEGRIAKARQAAAVEYIPGMFSDEELKKVFKGPDVEKYKKLRVANTEWSRVVQEAKGAGRTHHDEDLTPDERRLQAGASEYKQMSYVMRAAIEVPVPKLVARSWKQATDDELKKLLDLESIADYIKGKDLATDYHSAMLRWTKAGKKGSTPPGVTEARFRVLKDGKRLYVAMLKVIRQAREALPGQTALIHLKSITSDEEGKERLFTAEEETRVKQVLSVEEIEEYVEGRRAERDRERAPASGEAVSQEELEEFQRKVVRYHELRKKVDEQYKQPRSTKAGRRSPRPGASADGPEPARHENDGPDGNAFRSQHESQKPYGQPPGDHFRASTIQRSADPHQHLQSSGRRRARQPGQGGSNDPSAGQPFHLSTDPSFYADRLRLGWKDLNSRLLHSLRSTEWHLPSRPTELIPNIGSSVRNALRANTFRAPARIGVPLRV